MKIWITRHGQTKYNKDRRMQGLTDEPLNDVGREQARAAREAIGDVKFDAVYASPLDRAIETASVIGGVPRDQVIVDPRIIEVDFGKYELQKFTQLGFPMWLYWALPEVFHAPATVEPKESMIQRSREFLQEIESKDYENVLIACHGGIIRTLCGYLKDAPNGLAWRPKPHNCEIRVFETEGDHHRMVADIRADK
jgi:broad specificity phosphatase PhoE